MSDQILNDPRAGWAMALCSGDCNSAWLLSDLWFLDGEIICDDCLHEADCFDDRLARAQPFIGPDKNRIAELEAENARLRNALKEEPVAFEYQHEETGVIGYIDQWQIDNGFFKNNPRLQLIGPLYRHPPAREMSHE